MLDKGVRMTLSRRRALLLGAGSLAGAATLPGCGHTAAGGTTVNRLPSPAPASPELPKSPEVAVATHRQRSRARGAEVTLVTAIPTNARADRLPVCLFLHGRRMSATSLLDLGLPDLLTEAIRAGLPPLALAAVDGGSYYWIRNSAKTAADDPQAMLRTELPGWLRGVGLTAFAGVPRAVVGISMGCFGALVYAAGRPTDPPATAVLSPALFRSWSDARTVHGFANQASWSAAEPLQHPIPLPRLGVWCGRQDPFYPSTKQLIAGRHPTLTRLTPGGHTPDYWRRVFPEALRFVAA
jgi:S-formylglutathione hydrolase FrmB